MALPSRSIETSLRSCSRSAASSRSVRPVTRSRSVSIFVVARLHFGTTLFWLKLFNLGINRWSATGVLRAHAVAAKQMTASAARVLEPMVISRYCQLLRTLRLAISNSEH